MFKGNKNKIILIIAIIAVLAIAFFTGGKQSQNTGVGNVSSSQQAGSSDTDKDDAKQEDVYKVDINKEDIAKTQDQNDPEDYKTSEEDTSEQNKVTDDGESKPETDNTKTQQEKEAEISEVAKVETKPTEENKELTCKLSVKCYTIQDNLDSMDSEKLQLVPEDGAIFAETTVVLYEGESVFNVLQREMKKNKIHMEFTNTPVYNASYIEGIGNIYEMDCGELSGWMYRVNGEYPNYGASRYQLKDGDVVEWIYTCDLGKDIGGENFASQKE